MTAQNAASLVEQSKKWATSYGDFSNGPEGAAVTAVLRARAAWDANDADALASLFTDNGSLVAGDAKYEDPKQIRQYFTSAFADSLAGSTLTATPIAVRLLSNEVSYIVTQGRINIGDDGPAEDDTRTTWVVVNMGGEQKIASYQSNPIG